MRISDQLWLTQNAIIQQTRMNRIIFFTRIFKFQSQNTRSKCWILNFKSSTKIDKKHFDSILLGTFHFNRIFFVFGANGSGTNHCHYLASDVHINYNKDIMDVQHNVFIAQHELFF